MTGHHDVLLPKPQPQNLNWSSQAVICQQSAHSSGIIPPWVFVIPMENIKERESKGDTRDRTWEPPHLSLRQRHFLSPVMVTSIATLVSWPQQGHHLPLVLAQSLANGEHWWRLTQREKDSHWDRERDKENDGETQTNWKRKRKGGDHMRSSFCQKQTAILSSVPDIILSGLCAKNNSSQMWKKLHFHWRATNDSDREAV